jgi:hypothetical protein
MELCTKPNKGPFTNNCSVAMSETRPIIAARPFHLSAFASKGPAFLLDHTTVQVIQLLQFVKKLGQIYVETGSSSDGRALSF